MSKANALEQQMLDLINAERAAVGAAPLTFDDKLNDSSEEHSKWMLEADNFSHTGVGGSTPHARMSDAGFKFEGNWASGENIGYQSERGEPGLADDVVDIHKGLMNSPGHRANILNPDFKEIGIGIERGDFTDGSTFDSVMVTQNFAATDAVDTPAPAEPDPAPTDPVPTPTEPDLVTDNGDGSDPETPKTPETPVDSTPDEVTPPEGDDKAPDDDKIVPVMCDDEASTPDITQAQFIELLNEFLRGLGLEPISINDNAGDGDTDETPTDSPEPDTDHIWAGGDSDDFIWTDQPQPTDDNTPSPDMWVPELAGSQDCGGTDQPDASQWADIPADGMMPDMDTTANMSWGDMDMFAA